MFRSTADRDGNRLPDTKLPVLGQKTHAACRNTSVAHRAAPGSVPRHLGPCWQPKASRYCLDALFLLLVIEPRSITTSLDPAGFACGDIICCGGDRHEGENDHHGWGGAISSDCGPTVCRRKGSNRYSGNHRHDLRLLCLKSAVCTGRNERR